MTDWSNVEFASTGPESRKAHDFLPILGDLLTFWDFAICVLAGEGALVLYARYTTGIQLDSVASGPFWRDIVFGSLIAALMLRDPVGLCNRRFGNLTQFVLAAERRCLLAFTVLIVVGLATRTTGDLARLWLMSWLVIFASTVAGTRALCGWYLKLLHGGGQLRESIAIIGAPDVRDRLAARIAGEADVVGTFCAENGIDDTCADHDDLSSLMDLGRGGGVDCVILALERDHHVDVDGIVQRLKSLPVQVAVCADEGWSGSAAPRMRLLGGLPMAVVADRPIKRWNLLLKTVLDKVGAILLLVLLAPLLLAAGLAVGLTSPGPIIFRQRRQGWCGQDFVVFKFRTMHVEEPGARRFQTQRDDARCTRVGRVLRRSSLDELPQLWNVLRGEMSLVGPRPHAASLHDIDRAGREVVAEYAQRHRVKPGITGWAQVHGARGATATLDDLRRRVDYDLFYIENWSLWLDLLILLRTPLALVGENAF